MGGGDGRFSGLVPGTQSPLWAWAEARVCFAYWEDRGDLWKGWCVSCRGRTLDWGNEKEWSRDRDRGGGGRDGERDCQRAAGWEGGDREGEEGSAAPFTL